MENNSYFLGMVCTFLPKSIVWKGKGNNFTVEKKHYLTQVIKVKSTVINHTDSMCP